MPNIQIKDAERLREDNESELCDHPQLLKEYDFGSATGDYICSKCGAFVWGPTHAKARARADESAGD